MQNPVPRFPLPPNFPLLSLLRQKSQARAMANARPLYEFVGEIPPDLLCGICLLVPHDPHRVSCCGRYFCQPCITEWVLTQCYQCPSCFRPNCTHHVDLSLSQRVLLLHIYCTNRQKGCSWQGSMRDLQPHLTTEDGCPFSLVECPLGELGCQPRTFLRRDLSKHMSDKHSHHMRALLGRVKHMSSRLESQEKKMENLQQRFLMFSSHVSCTLGNLSCLGVKTTDIIREFEKMRKRVEEMERVLLRVRPHNLSHLHRALSDTFPPLHYFSEDGELSDDMSLNSSLLQGLREIEEKGCERERVEVGGGEVVTGEGEDEAGLPQAGELPVEEGRLWRGEDVEEKVKEETGLRESGGEEGEEEKEEGEEMMSSECVEWDAVRSKPFSHTAITHDPAPSATASVQFSYATAVSNPFQPKSKGLHSSTAPTKPNATSQTSTMVGNHGNECHMDLNTKTEEVEPVAVSQVEGAELTVQTDISLQISGVLEDGFGAIAKSGPAGWMNWTDGSLPSTPRSDSACSLKSSSSSEFSFSGDTVIHYGSTPIVVSTTSGKKSPSPDPTQVKLFVKYMPHSCSPERAVSLFVPHGKVYLLEYHSEHRDKLFLIMDRDGGLQAMSALNGIRLEGSPKPLSVQLYRSPSASTPIQRSESITADKCVRLFVKHLPTDMTSEEITELFTAHGKVFDVQKHPNRRNVAFVYMCHEGGKKAIAHLHGNQPAQLPKPLVVELSHDPIPCKS